MAKSIRQLDNCDWSSTPSTCQTMGQLLVRCDRPSLDGIMSSPWNYAGKFRDDSSLFAAKWKGVGKLLEINSLLKLSTGGIVVSDRREPVRNIWWLSAFLMQVIAKKRKEKNLFFV
ncbi:hypothetical protein CDAR_43041 [Caerostris darwini]|uniref:Uncharacterized protein n=1 Tax=Caerostris darwini TaxID=1538125 RepID=A0AAV4WJ14_9ARAC|nr:hypothetical protein CDAR_43041 [Caerostris darwini]